MPVCLCASLHAASRVTPAVLCTRVVVLCCRRHVLSARTRSLGKVSSSSSGTSQTPRCKIGGSRTSSWERTARCESAPSFSETFIQFFQTIILPRQARDSNIGEVEGNRGRFSQGSGNKWVDGCFSDVRSSIKTAAEGSSIWRHHLTLTFILWAFSFLVMTVRMDVCFAPA